MEELVQAYLGSESDEDEEPQGKKQRAGERYRQLLTGSSAKATAAEDDEVNFRGFSVPY